MSNISPPCSNSEELVAEPPRPRTVLIRKPGGWLTDAGWQKMDALHELEEAEKWRKDLVKRGGLDVQEVDAEIEELKSRMPFIWDEQTTTGERIRTVDIDRSVDLRPPNQSVSEASSSVKGQDNGVAGPSRLSYPLPPTYQEETDFGQPDNMDDSGCTPPASSYPANCESDDNDIEVVCIMPRSTQVAGRYTSRRGRERAGEQRPPAGGHRKVLVAVHGENPQSKYRCSCGEWFSTKKSLRSHIIYTEVGKVFECEQPSCGEAFRLLKRLKEHLASTGHFHSAFKPGQSDRISACGLCGAFFFSGMDRDTHLECCRARQEIDKRARNVN